MLPSGDPVRPTPFAQTIKRARLAAGLSQADLASKAGLTGSYVCLLESGRRPPPSAEAVTSLAKALGLDGKGLREQADLARAPEPLRRRIAGLAREKHRVRRSRDAILTTTLFHVARRPGFLSDAVAEALGFPEEHRLLLGRVTHRVREFPTPEQAASRADEVLKDVPGRERNALVRALPRLLTAGGGAAPERVPEPAADAPAAGADDAGRPWRVPVRALPPAPGTDPARGARDAMALDRRLHRPGAYLLEAADDEAYPRFERGDLLLVDPGAAPEDGDWVVLREGARARVRRLARDRLESPRPDVPPLPVPDPFVPAGVVTWLLRPLRASRA
jgi:transcriptional regulator with XRE-family HTH domain